MENALIPFNDMQAMAETMTRSNMFGKTKEQLLSLMLIAQAEGIHPAIAAQEYDVIQGRPAINSRAVLARFQSAGGSIRWLERTDHVARAELSHPQGGTLVVEWTIERAKQAQLYNKCGRDQRPEDNMWHKFPAQMLSARVVAEGVRAVFPACLSRMYTVEEVQDLPSARPSKPSQTPPRDVTPHAEPAASVPEPLFEGKDEAEDAVTRPADEPHSEPPPAASSLTAEEHAAAVEEMNTLLAELGTTVTAKAEGKDLFPGVRKTYYREAKESAKARGIEGLKDLRALVEAARVEADSTREKFTAKANASLSPAAQRVAKAAGVNVPEPEPVAAGADLELY